MSNSSYSPKPFVRQMHEVLHLSDSLTERDNTFAITADSTWNDYTESLLPIPIICMAIALLFVVAYTFATCCAGCCCKRTPPQEEVRAKKLRNYRILFFLAFIAVLVFDQAMIFGSKYLGNGVSTADNSLDFVGNTFILLNDYGTDLTQDGQVIQSDFSNSATINNCAEAASLNSYMDDYFQYVNEYNSEIEDVPDQVNDAQDALHQYGEDYKNKTIWVFYAMFIVCICIYAIGMIFRQRIAVFVGIGVSDVVMILVFLICGVTMIILMLLADFCMDPTNNLLQIAPNDVQEVASYYATCTGTNPLDDPLNSATDLVNDGKAATQAVLDSSCPGDQYLQDALVQLDSVQATINNITATMACPPLQRQVQVLLNDGLCGDFFKGMYVIWLTMYVCGAGLLLCSIIAACAYPYFRRSLATTIPADESAFAPHRERQEDFYNHPGADGYDHTAPSEGPGYHASAPPSGSAHHPTHAVSSAKNR